VGLSSITLSLRPWPECIPESGDLPRKAELNWKKRRRQIEQLRAKHGNDRSLAREFPDLKVEQRPAPCTNGMRGSTARRVQPPGMKRFPVGHSHKQGLELITPSMDLQWMGGKKT
jgi:hypothetical protein